MFVLALTQCTALMANDPSWSGIGHGILALAVVWWAWVLYAWLTSVVEPEEGIVRILMLAATIGVGVIALSVPQAFGDSALVFAVAYGLVRVGHIALYLIAGRAGPGIRRSVLMLAIGAVAATGLLVAAAFTDGIVQAMLWSIAIVVEWGLPAIVVDAQWRLVPAHFAERYGLVIIIALGESIVALGVGARVDLTGGELVAATVGIGLAAALWWTYFDVVSIVTRRRLLSAAPGREQIALARDSYSYLHFPMIAGIVLVAFGLRAALVHVDQPLAVVPAFALTGGVALYLLGHVALRLRNAHTYNVQRLVIAVVMLALVPAATRVDALATVVAVTALLWALITYETLFVYEDRRYRLRHGLDVEVPAPTSDTTRHE